MENAFLGKTQNQNSLKKKNDKMIFNLQHVFTKDGVNGTSRQMTGWNKYLDGCY